MRKAIERLVFFRFRFQAFFFAFGLICLAWPLGGFAQSAAKFQPMDWIDSKQAVFIQATDVSSLVKGVTGNSVWNLPSVVSVLESLNNEKVAGLFLSSGLKVSDILEPSRQLIDAIQLREAQVFLDSQSPWETGLIVCLYAGKQDLPEVAKAINQFTDSVLVDQESTKFVTQTVDGNQFIVNDASGITGFQFQDWLIFVPRLETAKKLVERFNTGLKPNRSFSENRKWLSSFGLLRKKGVIDIYFDPSISKQFFPGISQEQWQALGLNDVLGGLVRVHLGGQDLESNLTLISVIRCQVCLRIAMPRSGIWEALGAFGSLKEIPELPTETNSALFLDCKPTELLDQIETAIKGSFAEQIVASIENEAGRIGFDVREDMIPGWSGFFGNIEFTGDDAVEQTTMARETKHAVDQPVGDFCLVVGVRDREKMESLATRLLRSKDVERHATDQNVTSIFRSKTEHESMLQDKLARNRKTLEAIGEKANGLDESAAEHPNFGYLVSDELLVLGTEDRANEFIFKDFKSPVEAHEDFPSISRLLDEMSDRSQRSGGEPCLAYYFWSNKIMQQISTLIWNFERNRQQQSNPNRIDMRDFGVKLPDPNEAKSLNEWFNSAVVNVLFGVAESLQVGAVELSVNEQAIWVEGGLFSKRPK
jgi:hypothetical protein